jgi:hypothetical protein
MAIRDAAAQRAVDQELIRRQDQQEPPDEPKEPEEPKPEPDAAHGLATAAAPAHEPEPAPEPRGGGQNRPPTAAEAALQVLMKWLDHTSDAAELALSDPELAEAQAQSITVFYQTVLAGMRRHFPTLEPFDRP